MTVEIQQPEEKKKVGRPSKEEVAEREAKRIADLEEENRILREKNEQNAEQLDPKSGPGPDCEAYKLHLGEAVRKGVEPRAEIDYTNLRSNCESRFTKLYKNVQGKRLTNGEYEHHDVYLCKKHSNILLGK